MQYNTGRIRSKQKLKQKNFSVQLCRKRKLPCIRANNKNIPGVKLKSI